VDVMNTRNAIMPCQSTQWIRLAALICCISLIAACGEQPAQVDEPDTALETIEEASPEMPSATNTVDVTPTMTATLEPPETETVDEPDIAATTATTGEELSPTAIATAEVTASALQDGPAPIEVTDTELDTVPPVDVAAQLYYLPPQLGGSTNIDECRVFEDSVGGEPQIMVTEDVVDVGERLTICYFNFTGTSIEETVRDRAGNIMRTASFPAETYTPPGSSPLDIDATDYMPLPGDLAGIYTITAQTPEGEFSQTFEVTEQIAFPADGDPFVGPRGRGTGETSPELLEDGYLFISGYMPNEMVTFSFWQACESTAARQQGLLGADFVASGDVTVNANGQAFVRVPPEVGTELEDAIEYIVGINSTQTPNNIGGPDWIEGAMFSAYGGNAFGSLAGATQPPCEGEEALTEPTASAGSAITPDAISSSSPDSEPQLAFDGTLDTAWQVSGDGVGEFILLEFDEGVTIQDIQMVPGFDATDPESGANLFTQYRRVRSVRLEFSDGSSTEATLASFATFQSVLMNPVTTSSVKMTILETTEPGSDNGQDALAISEIKVSTAE
jgi:hypothetical protein